jgi:hypothetical protein
MKTSLHHSDYFYSTYLTLLFLSVLPTILIPLKSLVLLNILVALFNQAYSVVTDNAVDEFLALFSHKTLSFIRAPDENTFCPPLNLIEIFVLIPLEPFLKKSTYQRLNEIVMKFVYSPVLTMIAFYESKFPPHSVPIDRRIQARKIAANRLIGLAPGDESMGWDIEEEFNAEDCGWSEKVRSTIPRIEEDEMALLRRIEEKMDSELEVEDKKSYDKGRENDNGTKGAGGEEVATEAEGSGFIGPSGMGKR